jgi:glycosyltransferase involved in cell wall biosynthesis
VFLKWVYSYIDIAFYVGTHNKAYFKSFGLKENQLVFAPHAIDNGRFERTPDNKTKALKWRENLGIKSGDIVFLYAGKLDENKNTRMLADAFVWVNEPSTHLLIAGNGVCEESLKQAFGSKANIHFLPFQNQTLMPDLYAMADVFVLPSLSETWGLSINEAMASGKPVLVSDTCGAAIDLVQEGVNGYVFQSGSKKDLKEKMKKFIQPETNLKKMGNASLSIIKDWNYERDCVAIESVFN